MRYSDEHKDLNIRNIFFIIAVPSPFLMAGAVLSAPRPSTSAPAAGIRRSASPRTATVAAKPPAGDAVSFDAQVQRAAFDAKARPLQIAQQEQLEEVRKRLAAEKRAKLPPEVVQALDTPVYVRRSQPGRYLRSKAGTEQTP